MKEEKALTYAVALSLPIETLSTVSWCTVASCGLTFSHRGLLYKLRSIDVGKQFLSIVSQFLSDRGRRVRLDNKVSVMVGVVSGVPQATVIGPLLIILCNSELFHIFGNYMVGYEDDTTIYAVTRRPLSRPQVTDLLNRDLLAVHSWCFNWQLRLNPNKTKTMVVSDLCSCLW